MEIKQEDVVDISNDLDIPTGDNEQVLAMAALQNVGQAIADNDLYPEGGNYLVHTFPGEFRIYVHKASKTEFYFVCDVYDYAIKEWEKKFEKKKVMSANLKAETGDSIPYDVPIWIIFDLLLNQGVHPFLDEKEFEQVLWDIYPKLWIDDSKAPKRIIT